MPWLWDRLSSAVVKAASNAQTYAGMADSFVQAGLQCPKLPSGPRESHKRRFSGSPLPFHSKKSPSHTKSPHSDNKVEWT